MQNLQNGLAINNLKNDSVDADKTTVSGQLFQFDTNIFKSYSYAYENKKTPDQVQLLFSL